MTSPKSSRFFQDIFLLHIGISSMVATIGKAYSEYAAWSTMNYHGPSSIFRGRWHLFSGLVWGSKLHGLRYRLVTIGSQVVIIMGSLWYTKESLRQLNLLHPLYPTFQNIVQKYPLLMQKWIFSRTISEKWIFPQSASEWPHIAVDSARQVRRWPSGLSEHLAHPHF